MVCLQAKALIENVGYPDYIVDIEYMAKKYKEVCFDFCENLRTGYSRQSGCGYR